MDGVGGWCGAVVRKYLCDTLLLYRLRCGLVVEVTRFLADIIKTGIFKFGS